MALLRQPKSSQNSVGCCSEGAQGGTKHVSTMEVDGTDYHQLDALISDHPLVTAFLCGQGRTMNYTDAFNTVKQAKAFCQEHFNGLDLQAVYHPWEHHCATAAWGGRAKGAHICTIKALPKLYQAQSQMHAQQAQDVPLNQMEVINASPAIAARQGTDTQVGAPEEGAGTTGVENGTWSSDVSLLLLDLPYEGMPSPTVTLDTHFGAYGYQRTSTEAETDYKRAQPSNIQDVANPGEMSTRVVYPLATATGSFEHGQPIAPTGSRGGATIVDHDMNTPQERGGQADMEMTGATSGIGHDQALQGLDGGVHRVPAIPLVGKGVDGDDQTVAGELAWGTEPPTVSTEMEVDILDEKQSLEISPAQKGPIQSSMVTPRISWHIPINEAHLAFIDSNLDAIKGIKNTCPCSRGNGERFMSMTVNHRNQGKSPSIKVYECIQKIYEYLHKADPTATINPLYNEEEEDSHKFVLITEPSLFSSNMVGIHNHIHICNLYTMSPENGNDDEGNPKFQCPTYVVLRVTTKYAFDHIVGLIQSYLTEMNMFVKEKEMPSLNTWTCLAIIGTTADWCPVSLRKILHKDLDCHVESL
jgi:hypothetical protein